MSELGRAWIWDESANPALNHKYWMARELVRALPSKCDELVIGTCGNYGVAMLLAARERRIRATVFIPETTPAAMVTRLRALSPAIVAAGRTYEDAVAASKDAARAGRVADANVDGPWEAFLLRGVARRLLQFVSARAIRGPARVWIPTGNGTTVAGCGAAVAELDGQFHLCAVSSAGNNSITTSLMNGASHSGRPPDSITESPENIPLCNWQALHGAEAVAAVRASSGFATEVGDEELCNASRRLTELGVSATPAGAAGMAGLLRHESSDGFTEIVLVTSRTLAWHETEVGAANLAPVEGIG